MERADRIIISIDDDDDDDGLFSTDIIFKYCDELLLESISYVGIGVRGAVGDGSCALFTLQCLRLLPVVECRLS